MKQPISSLLLQQQLEETLVQENRWLLLPLLPLRTVVEPMVRALGPAGPVSPLGPAGPVGPG